MFKTWPAGRRLSSRIVAMVGTEIPASSTAGRIVHVISSLELPCVCAGIARPGRWRKRKMANTSAPSTNTNTTTAIQKTGSKRLSILRAYGPCGSREFCGNDEEVLQAANTTASATNPRMSRTFFRTVICLPASMKVGTGTGAGRTIPPALEPLVRVQAHDPEVHHVIRDEERSEADQCDDRGLSPSPSGGGAGVEVPGEHHPRDERP